VDEASLPAPDLSRTLSAAAAPAGDIEQKLAGLWESLLGINNVSVQDDFFALGGHSLLAIRLFSLIETELGRQLPLATLFEAPTIAQLAERLRDTHTPAAWDSLVPIQPQGRRPPFFCVHYFGGSVVCYAELARLLGDDQPFFGLQAQGLQPAAAPHESIESMAEHYVAAVRARQPHGPYYLGGYCFGGTVVYEMARQLRAAGETVALTVILDGYAPVRSQAGQPLWTPRLLAQRLANLPHWLADFVALARNSVGSRLRRARRRSLRFITWRLRLGTPLDAGDVTAGDEPMPEHLRRLREVHSRASRAYLPGPYDGKLVLFNIRSQPLRRTPSPARGWDKLASGGVTIRRIPGQHYNFLFPPHVQTVAKELGEALRQSRADP
jgi:thioesterase domain-containing protein